MKKMTFEEFHEYLKELNYWKGVLSLLHWDQEVYMPEDASEYRSKQIAALSKLLHQKATNEQWYQNLLELSKNSNLNDFQKKNIALVIEDVERQKKLPEEFVIKMSETTARAFHYWHKAKTENRFEIFAPWLEKLIELKKQEITFLGQFEHPYDALLNDYDKGLTVSKLMPVFEHLKTFLPQFVQNLPQEFKDAKYTHVLKQNFEKEKQWEFTKKMIEKLGFSFKSGRLDLSPHPFSINIGSGDVRITTKVNESDISEIIWSTLHEMGHAFYEAGLNPAYEGLPAADACSLSIHESQSRIWENNVGRSKFFWNYFLPQLKNVFPSQLGNIEADAFYFAVNHVEPSLIRIEADELTYHLHVFIRFTIEKEIFEGKTEVNDLPQRWNGLYRKYLGVEVPSDDQGILQDVHWSHGSFGYFPTYTLGSLYAAQFFEQATQDIPKLTELFQHGDYNLFYQWLKDNVYSQGRLLTSEELCQKITGRNLDVSSYQRYVQNKFAV